MIEFIEWVIEHRLEVESLLFEVTALFSAVVMGLKAAVNRIRPIVLDSRTLTDNRLLEHVETFLDMCVAVLQPITWRGKGR